MQKKVKELIVVVLETLLITGVTVFSVLPVSCKFSQSGNVRGHNYDYDRFRGTVGMRLTY